MRYLYNQINLLRLFKSGNIVFRDVFFDFSFSVIGIISNKINICSHNQIRNAIATSQYTLSNKLEVDKCNQWINDYCNAPYELLKNCIEEFSWGLEQIDDRLDLNSIQRHWRWHFYLKISQEKNRC